MFYSLLFFIFYCLFVFIHSSAEYPDNIYYQNLLCNRLNEQFGLDYVYYHTIHIIDNIFGRGYCETILQRNWKFNGFGAFEHYMLPASFAYHIANFPLQLFQAIILALVFYISGSYYSLLFPFIFNTSFITSDFLISIAAMLFFRWPLSIATICFFAVFFKLSSQTVLASFLPILTASYILFNLQVKLGAVKAYLISILASLFIAILTKHYIGNYDIAAGSQLALALEHNADGNNRTFLSLLASLIGTFGYMSFINIFVLPLLGYVLLKFAFSVRHKSQYLSSPEFVFFVTNLCSAIVISGVIPWVGQIRFYPLLLASAYTVLINYASRELRLHKLKFIMLFNFLSIPIILLTW